MKNILVTGGAGFIGSNFVRHMLGKCDGVEIWDLDQLTYAGKIENLADLPGAERHHFIQGDICDRELVERTLRENEIDTIVHFAAETHVDRSISGPAPFIVTNIVGTFNLLEAARTVWGERQDVRFHHISTDEVFGALMPGDEPFRETTPYTPHSPYSASKASSDHLVRAYQTTYGLPATISNCSNNYGPYQFPEKLVPLTILNCMMGKPLPVYGKGEQVRDWLHVGDHCEAIRLILEKGKSGETYCIGGENQPSNLEIVELLCAIMDEEMPLPDGKPHSSLITFVTDRPGHDFRYDIDTAKIRRELGWKPTHDLESGMRDTVRWYLSHTDWIKSVLNQPAYSAWLEKNYEKR